LKLPFEIVIALRYLRSKRKRSAVSVITWLSVGGVAIGVMALTVVLSVMNGFDADLKTKIVGLNAHILVLPRHDEPFNDYDKVVQSIRNVKHVKSVGPYAEGQALAKASDRSLGIAVWGVDPDAPQAVADLDKYLFEAKATDLKPEMAGSNGRKDRMFLGRELARRLGVGLGDDVILFLPILQQTPLGMMPVSRKFQVVGVFSTGMYDYDASFAYTALDTAKTMFNLGSGSTGVAVKVDDVDRAPEVAQVLREQLHGRYVVQDWLQMNQNLFKALRTEKFVMAIILSLIVLVAALNIVNPLTMSVIEKMKEIGILKAMGANDRSIASIFIVQGLVIGVLGTFLGAVLGYGLCEIIARVPIPMPGGGSVYYIDRLPVMVDPILSYVLIPLGSVALCFLTTLFPARQAGKMEPVEAIRYE
jgi:lipoprotein-releasing system permease protein